jgi:ElaA protein
VELRWHLRAFEALSARELYAILALRSRVFVVEQACVYLDPDGHDAAARHLWAEAEDGAVVAYLRILPAGAKFAECAIGRVVIAPEQRGTGLGYALMRRGLAALAGAPARLAAQAHLERFYANLGFARVGEIYVEDGIPHVDMRRA